MAIELVAFDLDGTILEHGGTIAGECVAAIRTVRRSGVRCVVDSGRGTDFQAELLSRHGLLAHFDALIGDERWIQLVDRAPAAADEQPGLRPLEPWNTEVRRHWDELEPVAAAYCRRLEERAVARGWPCQTSDPLGSRSRGLWSAGFDSADHALAMLEWLEPQLSAGPLAANCNGSIVHIHDRAADKGTTLVALAGHFGVAAEDVLAIGDNFNDKPLLDGRHQFRAATVDNADPAVKEWVRRTGGWVADRPCGAGVADLLADVAVSPAEIEC